MHPMLVELARETGGAAYESREISDAYVARSMGLPALRISTTETGEDDVDTDALTRVHDFTAALLERIDEQIGPRLR
jgi:Iap family predicted aminopeptidase